jgi:hypothetical protein
VNPTGRRALVAVAVSSLLVALYVLSFIVAQAKPTPHRVPVAIVGTGAVAQRAAARVARAAGQPFDVRRAGSERVARMLIADRRVYAALVPAAHPRLLTAPAAGVDVARTIEERLPGVAGVAHTPQVLQIRPLVAADPDGQALNLSILPLTIFGCVMPLLLTVLAPDLRVRERLPMIGAFALVGGALAVFVAGPLLGTLPGAFLPAAATSALTLFAVCASTTALLGLLGPFGVTVAMVAFLFLGNVASGAAVQNELLPGFFRTVGPWLPAAAAAQTLRNLAYFDGVDILVPLLVLTGFAVAGVAVSVLVGDRRPAAQGDPSGPTADKGA